MHPATTFSSQMIRLFKQVINVVIAGQQEFGLPTDTRSSVRFHQVDADAEEPVDWRRLLCQDAVGSAQVLSVGRHEARTV